MPGSTVNGSVVVIGGSLNAAGTIHGDLNVRWNVETNKYSGAEWQFIHGGCCTREPGAQVNGEIYTERNIRKYLPFLV
jgi:hypothetical protein